ncbi:MAG: hypothetical protein II537_03790, partial [Bacteroidales bacterium]|nr:hypothetical protein [Bacteroidales bacterium]
PAACVHPEPGSNSSLYKSNSQLEPDAFLIPKESTLSFTIVSRYLLVLSNQSFKDLVAVRFSNGVAKVHTFFFCANFF